MKTKHKAPIILQSGFRIFFLGAAVYAVSSMAFWLWFYVAGKHIFVSMPLTIWHGHEMIFGFTMAVVAGFLLTAVTNWTGLATLSGWPLGGLFFIWLLARVFAFMPPTFPGWMVATTNILFLLLLTVVIMRPIAQVKQWKQSAVFSKLMLMLVAACVFYAALFSADLIVQRKVLKFTVYLIISLILTIARRVMPFFIERGVGQPLTLRNSKLLDISSLVLLIVFAVTDMFINLPVLVCLLCACLVVVHALRLKGWYTPLICQHPLLWILFIGYIFIIVGFLLKGISCWVIQTEDAALHAFTAGGIGIFTLGMMARVAWGHTGRMIAQPPRAIRWVFLLIILAALCRVLMPLVVEPFFIFWILLSQILWMVAFIMYLTSYGPVLLAPRPDGKMG